MAEKYRRLVLSSFLATMLLIQGVAFMPVNSQEAPEPASVNSDPSNWYIIVSGNLASDEYHLYPYEIDANTKIGFSRFGEMINSINTVRVGLEYRDQDVFAPPAGSSFVTDIPPSSWLQGWLINITYHHSSAGIRNVWASAQHADTIDLAKNWLRVDDDYQDNFGATVSTSGSSGSNNPNIRNDAEELEDPADKGCLIDLTDPTNISCSTVANGGRKTNGSAITGPIEVLYDGPRRFVGVTHTTIYDLIGDDETLSYDKKELVDVVFTIDYNKVTKEVNVIKDVKMAPQAKFTIGTIDVNVANINYTTAWDGKYTTPTSANYTSRSVEGMLVSFSNRGEFDLQSDHEATNFKSFVHFYTYGASHSNDTESALLPTKYDNEYTLLRTLPPQTILRNTALNAWGSEPAGSGSLTTTMPVDGKTFGTYDVAQIISSNAGNTKGSFVAWAAFWPSLSDWDVDGGRGGLWYQSLEYGNPHRIDTTDEPFRSPYIIGEWDFLLTNQPVFIDPDNALDGDELEGDIMFRGVSQYGLVDRHDELVTAFNINDFPTLDCNGSSNVPYGRGDDANATDSDGNILDPEVAYYLRMKFCPWDLSNAGNKDSQRHLMIDTSPFDFIPLEAGGSLVSFTSFYSAFANGVNINIGDATNETEEWRAYSTFAERLVAIDDDTGSWKLLERGVDYMINNNMGNAEITYLLGAIPPGTDRVEIYFSISGLGSYEWTVVGRDSNVIDSAAASMVTAGFNNINGIVTPWAALDMKDPTHPTGVFLHQKFGNGDARTDYYYNNDQRSALKKYWSTTIPIASSNIISVGGPGANLVTEYSNEFMPSIYRGGFFNMPDLLLGPSWDALGNGNEKPSRLSGQVTQNNPDSVKYNITDNINPSIIPPSSQEYGWAVVSTYKDINGTVFFNIWGATGNDSFWAAQAFQNGLNLNEDETYKDSPLTLYKEVIDDNDLNGPDSDDDIVAESLVNLGGDENSIAEWIEDEEIPGVTVLVLWIEYTDENGEPLTSLDGGYHPKITIVEELGIISEVPQHDP